jgi:hypothetical protein
MSGLLIGSCFLLFWCLTMPEKVVGALTFKYKAFSVVLYLYILMSVSSGVLDYLGYMRN